jgi:hypothetical protein
MSFCEGEEELTVAYRIEGDAPGHFSSGLNATAFLGGERYMETEQAVIHLRTSTPH